MRHISALILLSLSGCVTLPKQDGVSLSSIDTTRVLESIRSGYPHCGKHIRLLTSCPPFISQLGTGQCVLAFSHGASPSETNAAFFPVFLSASDVVLTGLMIGPVEPSDDPLIVPGDHCEA
jgi:hypothetical protein